MSKGEGLFQVKIKASFLQNHHNLSSRYFLVTENFPICPIRSLPVFIKPPPFPDGLCRHHEPRTGPPSPAGPVGPGAKPGSPSTPSCLPVRGLPGLRRLLGPGEGQPRVGPGGSRLGFRECRGGGQQSGQRVEGLPGDPLTKEDLQPAEGRRTQEARQVGSPGSCWAAQQCQPSGPTLSN